MDDALLFLHVLSAFLLMATVVLYGAVALGAPLPARGAFVADRLWDVGGLGTLAFGLWIVGREDAYEIGDGWIVGALVLWFVVTGVGQAARGGLEPAVGPSRRGIALHWLRALLIVGFLVLMIWKPGA